MKYVQDELNKFISLRVIIDRIMRNPGAEDLPYDVATTVAVNTIQLLINPTFLISETDYIYVTDYRGELPSDYVDIKKVIKVDEDKAESSRTAMLINQDPFFSSYSGRTFSDPITLQSDKYKIQGDYIYTTFESGTLHVSYTTLPTDFDGTIMIPDRVSLVKAVEFAILYDWLQKKWFANKISGDKVQWAEREANWYMSQASSDFALENLDKRQTLSNILTTMVNNTQHGMYEYRYLGDKEYRKNHI